MPHCIIDANPIGRQLNSFPGLWPATVFTRTAQSSNSIGFSGGDSWRTPRTDYRGLIVIRNAASIYRAFTYT